MSIVGLKEIKVYKTTGQQLLAEFIGTFLYLSITLIAGTELNKSVVATALSNGLLVASVIQIIGHISGGHINPAVTVGVFACGKIKLVKAGLYIVAQILGCLLGALVSYGVTDISTRDDLGATVPHPNLNIGQVFGLELIMTFILVTVVLSVLDTKKPKRGLGSGPLAIGLSITACQCSAVLYTGSMNPVRSLGPAVVMNIWTDHWVYWLAPITGGLTAGLIYRYLFTLRYEENVLN